jgi:hypothetical protein
MIMMESKTIIVYIIVFLKIDNFWFIIFYGDQNIG